MNLKEIQQQLQDNKNEDAILAAKKFIPNAQKIIGVRMPIVNELAKQYKSLEFEIVEQLWESGYYEELILAAKILGKIAKKNPLKSIDLVEKFSKDIDNWAVCDTLGMQSLKPIIKTHQIEIFVLANKLINSDNFWQRRLALVLVEWYTRFEELHPQINILLEIVKNDKEYYVKKAIVWLKKNMN